MASEYKFLNQSGCLKIHDVDDAHNFQKLMVNLKSSVWNHNLLGIIIYWIGKEVLQQGYILDQEAMDVLQISHEDQERIFKLLAAILWLGNISFEVTDLKNHVTVVIDEGMFSVLVLYNLCGTSREMYWLLIYI